MTLLLAAQVTGGTAPYQYNWSQGPAGPVNANLPPGIYTLSIQDANTCESTATVEVIEPNPLTMNFIAQAPACGSTMSGALEVQVSGGTLPYSYLWNDGFTGVLHDNIGGGFYEVTITDAKGCSLVDSYQLPVFSDMQISLQQTAIACHGMNENSAAISINGGTAPFQFLWSNGAMTNSVDLLSPGWHYATVTDSNGCSQIDSIAIASLDSIAIFASWTDPLCHNYTDGYIQIDSVQGGSGNYQYQWNYNNATTTQLNNLAGGSNYQLTLTDSNGCTNSVEVLLNDPDPISLMINQLDVSCFGKNDGAITVIPGVGQVVDYTYQWDAAAQFQTTNSIDSLTAGSYTIVVSDANGCTADTSIQIDQAEPILLSFEVTHNRCADEALGSIIVSSSGGLPDYQYNWLNGNSGDRIEQLPAAWYPVSVTDARGCVAIDSAQVNSPPPLSARLSTDPISCFGDEDAAIFVDPQGGTPPYLFSFDNSTFSSQNGLVGIGPGKYDAIVQDANGCLWLDGVDIEGPLPFSIDTGGDRIIQLGDSIQLWINRVNGTGTIDYVWLAPADSSLHCPNGGLNCFAPWSTTLHSATYTVHATDEQGCEAVGRVKVLVEKDRPVHVPTGFSPNDDGVNDLLLVHGRQMDGTLISSFQVYDRWGELIYQANDFELNDASIGWDGTFRGKEMNPGVYVWVLEIRYLDGYSEVLKGSTTLIR